MRPVRSAESASGEVRRAPFASREMARLLPILVPVALAGFAILGIAMVAFATSDPTPAVLAGVCALLLAATFVEAHPVPIEGISSEGISLAAVFIVGTAVIYGWAPAVIMGFLTRALIEVVQGRPFIRLSYNSAVYALGGAAAGLAAGLGQDEAGVASLLLQVLLGAAAFYAVNIPLIAGIIARWAREPFFPLL